MLEYKIDLPYDADYVIELETGKAKQETQVMKMCTTRGITTCDILGYLSALETAGICEITEDEVIELHRKAQAW